MCSPCVMFVTAVCLVFLFKYIDIFFVVLFGNLQSLVEELVMGKSWTNRDLIILNFLIR